MKKIFLLGFVLVLLGPISAHATPANYDSVTLGAEGAMTFSANGVTIELTSSGGHVATTTVNSGDFTIEIAPPTFLQLRAPNLNSFSVDYTSGATDYTLDSVCTGLSQWDISAGTATTTFTVTPSSTLCATAGGGGGGGADTPAPASSGGGGGGGGGAPGPVAVAATPTAPATPSAPSGNAALIASLQAQLQALLAQIAALTGGAAPSGGFARNLQTGSTGDDVKSLQVYLNSHGFPIASSGPGSSGNETTKFGGLTRAALAKFQASVGISPAAGYFGPKTRAYVNANP